MVSRKLYALAFIRGYYEEHGEGPSLGEIAAAIDASRPHAHRTVQRLVQDGHITKVAGKPRSIRLVHPAPTAVAHAGPNAGPNARGTREVTHGELPILPALIQCRFGDGTEDAE